MKKHIPLYLLLSVNICSFAMESSPQTSPRVERLVRTVGDATIEHASGSGSESDTDSQSSMRKAFYDEDLDHHLSHSSSPRGLAGRDPQERGNAANEGQSGLSIFELPFAGLNMRKQLSDKGLTKCSGFTSQQLKESLFGLKAIDSEKNIKLRKEELALKKLKLAYNIAIAQHPEPLAEQMKEPQEHAMKYFKEQLSKELPIVDMAKRETLMNMLRMLSMTD